jgi:hypothetical protein
MISREGFLVGFGRGGKRVVGMLVI